MTKTNKQKVPEKINLERRLFCKKVAEAIAVVATMPSITSLIACGGSGGKGSVGGSTSPTIPSIALTLDGLCYGPFREGQSPNQGIYPSEAQIREDINILKNTAGKIRTYGLENTLFNIPRLCNEKGLDCYPGAWIDDASADGQQVADAITIANSNYTTTKGVIIGNEFVLRKPSLKSNLIGYLNQTKASTSVPITTAEPWHIWRDHTDLAPNVDFITMHVFPYWEQISVDGAAQFVIDKYNLIKGLYPSKRVAIGETGWPSAGAINGFAVPSLDNQKKFISEFKQLAGQNIEYFIFEAFDEPHKIAEPGGVGPNWGTYYKNRTPKPALL